MSDAELEQLANDAVAGRIFTNFDCPNNKLLPLVFMPLSVLDKEAIVELRQKKPAMIYEYWSQACPRSINGMPIFFSCRFLYEQDFEKFKTRFNEIFGLLKARLKNAQEA